MKMFFVLSMMVALSSSAVAEMNKAPNIATKCGKDQPDTTKVTPYTVSPVTHSGSTVRGN